MYKEGLYLKKAVVIIIDVLLMLAMIVPVGALLWDCIYSAMEGVIPWGMGYGLDYGEKIYGFEAFRYVFTFDCVFFFILVILWVCLFVGTAAFTVFTVLYVKKNEYFPTAGNSLQQKSGVHDI